MEETHLYHQIAAHIRQEILDGRLKPGNRLAGVRQLCAQWNCTPGTVQRAYRLLAEEGLLVSRAGQGTQVAGINPQPRAQIESSMRRASLVNRAETFLLEMLTAGFSPAEIQQAVHLAMDRWRAQAPAAPPPPGPGTRFSGSHDPLLNDLAEQVFGGLPGGPVLELSYTGSLGGLMALAEGRAEMAGCHLWDAESDSYNLPFIRRLLPGRAVKVVTLAHRRLGWIVAPGNPLRLGALADLGRPGLRFVNRQSGSGTRVWLDAHLGQAGLSPAQIQGYDDQRLTHSDVARAIAEGTADAGLGLESAARAFGLDFIFLARERYDLVMLAETGRRPAVQALIEWLASASGKQFIDKHPGYESQESGQIQPID